MCKRNVVPKSPDFNVGTFLLLLCCTGCLWILYLIYYVLQSSVCPFCGSSSFSPAQPEVIAPTTQPVTQTIIITPPSNTADIPSKWEYKFCPLCGAELSSEVIYCPNCGTKI